MSQTWRVVKPEWVGNPDAGFTCEYYSGDDFPTKRAAIRGGWDMYGHDDWLLLRLYDGKADRLFWMAKERDDFEELQDVAKALGLGLTHVAEALASVDTEPIEGGLMGVTFMGASDDLLEVEGDIREEFNVLGDDELFIATSTGLLARVEYDRDGVWRFRPYTNGLGSVIHKEAPVGDDDCYSDTLDITEVTVEWVLVGTQMARVRKARASVGSNGPDS